MTLLHICCPPLCFVFPFCFFCFMLVRSPLYPSPPLPLIAVITSLPPQGSEAATKRVEVRHRFACGPKLPHPSSLFPIEKGRRAALVSSSLPAVLVCAYRMPTSLHPGSLFFVRACLSPRSLAFHPSLLSLFNLPLSVGSRAVVGLALLDSLCLSVPLSVFRCLPFRLLFLLFRCSVSRGGVRALVSLFFFGFFAACASWLRLEEQGSAMHCFVPARSEPAAPFFFAFRSRR